MLYVEQDMQNLRVVRKLTVVADDVLKGCR